MSHLNQGWWESGGERRQSAEAALVGRRPGQGARAQQGWWPVRRMA